MSLKLFLLRCFDSHVLPSAVANVVKRLLKMGCYEISLGDTTGVGTPVFLLFACNKPHKFSWGAPAGKTRKKLAKFLCAHHRSFQFYWFWMFPIVCLWTFPKRNSAEDAKCIEDAICRRCACWKVSQTFRVHLKVTLRHSIIIPRIFLLLNNEG